MTTSACPTCASEIPASAPGGLCPRCLLRSAIGPSDGSVTGPEASAIQRLLAGERFGPFLIHRLLGRGGMGEVYEAERVGEGRRVALKLITRDLDEPTARQRFAAEASLAARVTHPNVVYVFGAEDIEGVPVIVMELMTGGTLRDLVAAEGPLAPQRAVDVALQLVDALQAVDACGVLHGDIKPSNCFVDARGRVYLGDFGIARPIHGAQGSGGRSESHQPGTPAFASPEQLDGERVDVRSDIYSLGATLSYLLSGPTPSEVPGRAVGRSHLKDLNVGTAPTSLRRLIARCLYADPTERYQSYADLRRALEPFGTDAMRPAAWPHRLAAALVDAMILLPLQGALLAVLLGLTWPNALVSTGLAILLPTILYDAVAASLWGSTVGLRQLGLRLAHERGGHAGVFRVSLRTGVALSPIVLALVALAVMPHVVARSPVAVAEVAASLGVTMLFVWARPSNGFAAGHDLLTGTRVTHPVRTPPPQALPRSSVADGPSPATIGPYAVERDLGAAGDADVFLGSDPRLHRPVWIYVTAREEGRQGTSRSTGLRWLGGATATAFRWDAFEAPTGAPLLAATSPSLALVARGLEEIARELAEAVRARLAFRCSLDTIWQTDSTLIRLGFKAPVESALGTRKEGSRPTPLGCSEQDARAFLGAIAEEAFGRCPGPRPLAVTELLSRLQADRFPTVTDIADAAARLRPSPASLSVPRALALTVSVLTLACLLNALASLGPTAAGAGALLLTLGLVLSSAVWKGGVLLRVFGIAVVTVRGTEVSRRRAALRACVAWSWIPAEVLAVAHGWSALYGLAVALSVCGCLWAAFSRERSWPDLVAGTSLVPR